MRSSLVSLSLLLAASVGAGATIAPGQAAAPAPFAAPSASTAAAPAASDLVFPEQAHRQARATGRRVEITSLRSERETIFANPSGTRTLEATAVPTRVRRDGHWRDIDTQLRRNGDGSVSPVAAALEMRFSGGGDDPMVELSAGATKVRLGFPVRLPEPSVSGNEATYADVLPDVDLVLSAEPDTFREVLVVKSAKAARHPLLRELRLAVEAPGAEVRSEEGRLSVVDRSGIVELEAAAPIMWDSRGGTAKGRKASPRDGDKIEAVGAGVDRGHLVLRPSAAMLAARDTAYPVFIDPSWGPTKSGWAMVSKRNPGTSFWKWPTGDNGEGVGHYSYDPTTKRLFWNFPVSKLGGTKIISATFSAFQTWAWSCTKANVELWRTGIAGTGTTWDRQPAWSERNDTRYVNSGRDGCLPGGSWVEFNAKPAALDASAGNYSTLGMGLRASDEGSNAGWKRFNNDARLSVDYNSYPNKPSGVTTIEPSTKCVADATRPVIPLDPPKLSVNLSDPDSGQDMRAIFELFSGGISSGETPIFSYTTAFRDPRDANGNAVPYRVQVPTAEIAAGGIFTWRVRGQDRGVDGANMLYSPYSPQCQFSVDTSKPLAPTITPATENVYEVGRTVSFTVASTTTDVTSYRYSLNNDGLGSSKAGTTSALVTVTLNSFGPNTFYAQSVDKAGNVSGLATYEFVTTAAKPKAHFKLDEGTGGTTADALDLTRLMTLGQNADGTGVGWADRVDYDQTDKALHFPGANSAWSNTAANALASVDKGFSVSTWIRPSTTAVERMAVSQDGPGGSAFSLGVDNACALNAGGTVASCYSIKLTSSTGVVAIANTQSLPLWGEWQHLAAVYKSGTEELELYLDGQLVDSVDVAFDAPASTGVFRFGRSTDTDMTASAYYFAGYLDDVHVYDGPLDITQVRSDFAEYQP